MCGFIPFEETKPATLRLDYVVKKASEKKSRKKKSKKKISKRRKK